MPRIRPLRSRVHADPRNMASASIEPPKPNQSLQTRSPIDPWESPRFKPAGICSKVHLHRIYQKLAINNRTPLAVSAVFRHAKDWLFSDRRNDFSDAIAREANETPSRRNQQER